MRSREKIEEVRRQIFESTHPEFITHETQLLILEVVLDIRELELRKIKLP